MGKTFRTFKGEKYKPNTAEQKKSLKDKKSFGHMDDQYPVPGVDYIKYGYPKHKGKHKKDLPDLEDDVLEMEE